MPRAARWWTIYKRLFYLPISHKSKTRMLDGMRVLSVTIFALLTTTFFYWFYTIHWGNEKKKKHNRFKSCRLR